MTIDDPINNPTGGLPSQQGPRDGIKLSAEEILAEVEKGKRGGRLPKIATARKSPSRSPSPSN